MMDRILRFLGVDPHQYRILLRIGMTLDSRAGDSEERLNLTSFPAFMIAIYLILGLLVSLSAFMLSGFSFTFLMMAFSMTMMSFAVVLRLEGFINPDDYRVLAHMPVSSRTYFLVKLTNILIHVAMVSTAFNLPPSILGIWARNTPRFFPAVYLPASFLSSLFVMGLIASFYGYLIKLYRSGRLRDIIAYSQIIILFVFGVSLHLVPRLVFQLNLGVLNAIERMKWLYVLPYSWFAGLVHLGLGETEVHYLVLSAVAVISTLLLVIVPLRRISLRYSERISYMEESPGTARRAKRLRSSIIVLLFRNPETLAGFDLVSKYLCRDRNTKIRISAGLALPVMYIVMMVRSALEYKGKAYFDPGLAVGISISLFIMCVYFISFVLNGIKFSEHWGASWIITCSPLERPGNFFKGSKMAIICWTLLPLFTVFAIIYSFTFGISLSVVYLLPAFIGSLCYLSFYSASDMRFPFSLKPRKGRVNIGIAILGVLIFGVVMGVQYPVYRIHKGLYIALYISTVVAGLITFKVQEQRSNRRFDELAMKALQYELERL